ncbi:MAG: CAAD domain-containing protein [Cyanobacteria bacterium P01_H01_bin.15]
MEESQVKDDIGLGGVNPEPAGMLDKSDFSATTSAVQAYIDAVTGFLAGFTDMVGDLFAQYKDSLVNLLLLISVIITVYITLAVLGAINSIPLLAPLLELVGLGYTAWFIFRYVLKDNNRQELYAEIDALKAQVFGPKG